MTPDARNAHHTIRAAQRADITQAAAILGNAFFSDPLYQWLIPDDRLRRRALPHLFSGLLRRVHLRHGATDLAITHNNTVAAVAAWDPPGQWRSPAWRQLAQLPDVVRAFGRSTPSMLRGLSAVSEIERRHPEQPHWYLADVATDPAQQGQRVGRRLLATRLERCDAAGSSAYLEATSPRNAGLYETLGFRAVGEIHLHSGPVIVQMWRQPNPRDR